MKQNRKYMHKAIAVVLLFAAIIFSIFLISANRQKDLKKELFSKVDQVQQLEMDLSSKTDQIKQLEMDLLSKDDRIKQLEAALSSKADQIQQLGAELDAIKSPQGGVAEHGSLQIEGNQLCDENGDPLVLRGLSSHGIAWYPEYTNYRAMKTLRDYGANAFRIAVYPDQNDGYLLEPELNEKLLYAAIENSLAADMYTIVDWHVLRDENPRKHIDKAKGFFKSVSERYGQEPGIIYEICNEPNGNTTYRDIAEYANEIIPIIRKNSPNAIILVGTPKFCTILDEAIDSPLPFGNIMYTYHYYSKSSDLEFAKSQISKALDAGIPVFVSEWGINLNSKTAEKDIRYTNDFIKFMEDNKVSWINWSLSNKNEAYSFVGPEENSLCGWSIEQLSPSGRYVVSQLEKP